MLFMLNDIFFLELMLTLCVLFFELILFVKVINREVQLGLIKRVMFNPRIVEILSSQVFNTQRFRITTKVLLNVPSVIKVYLQFTDKLLSRSVGFNILESFQVIYRQFLLILSFEQSSMINFHLQH